MGGLASTRHQFVISSSSARHQLVISSLSALISSSSVHYQLVISSSSVRHQFVISSSSEKKEKREKEKERKKRKNRKRQTLEMASEGPQRITGKYYGVYLPSQTIYPFAINLSICHIICNLSTVLYSSLMILFLSNPIQNNP